MLAIRGDAQAAMGGEAYCVFTPSFGTSAIKASPSYRDANQFTGLTDSQSRNLDKLHFNASLMGVTSKDESLGEGSCFGYLQKPFTTMLFSCNNLFSC